MRKTLLTSILIVHAIAVSANAATRYVPSQYSTIQAAIDACNNGDTVIVADGTYAGEGNTNIDFSGKSIIVRSENGPASTIVDCENWNATRGFYFHSGEATDSILDGFCIVNGVSNWPAHAYWKGGGIYCGSSPTIKNCIIRDNEAGDWNCEWDSKGGGMYNTGNPTLINCTFHSNTSCDGGGIYNTGSPALINCLFMRNYAQRRGGGMYNTGSPTLINCTFSLNGANSYYGPGFGIRNFGSTTLTNCILWGNGSYESDQIYGGTAVVNYCCIQGWTGSLGGIGNIGEDPMFQDPFIWPSHLSSGSPCIDVGDPNSSYSGQTDIDGEPRVMHGRVDIGADEFPPSFPISDPITDTATQAGSGLDETDPNKMVEIANGDVCIKFVPIVSGGGSVTITELSCQTIEGDGVIIVENITGIRAITALDNGDYVSTLKVFYEEQDLPEGWTERDLRIFQLQTMPTSPWPGPPIIWPRWFAEFMYEMMAPEPVIGPPTLNVGDWGIDDVVNYVWANVDHFSDYGVGVKLVTGDYNGNRNVDFRDFSHFALNWQDVNCPYSGWCNGADLDFSAMVDFNDLAIFVYNWLYDANDPNTW